MLGFALTTEQIIEILSAYSAPSQEIEAVAATPGWHVIGALRMPVTFDGLQLTAIGSVSDASLTMRVRLYCITPGFVGPVSGASLTIASTTDVSAESGLFDLVGQRLYQFQAEVTGDVGDGLFGVIESASLQGGT
jgi:hypothetical protein